MNHDHSPMEKDEDNDDETKGVVDSSEGEVSASSFGNDCDNHPSDNNDDDCVEMPTTDDDDEHDEVAFATTTDDDEHDDEAEDEDDQLLPMESDHISLGNTEAETKKSRRPSPVKQGSIRGELLSNVLDLETGKVGGHRGRKAALRSQDSMMPRSSAHRRMDSLTKPLKNNLPFLSNSTRNISISFNSNDDDDNDKEKLDEITDLPAPRVFGGHVGVLRNQESMRPRNSVDRRKRNFGKFWGLTKHSEGESSEHDSQDEDEALSGSSLHSRSRDEEKNHHQTLEHDNNHDVEAGRQYHLEAVHPTQRPGTRLVTLLGLGTGGGMYFEDRSRGCLCGFTPNQVVMNYLHWSFRSSFAAVFLSAALGFLGLTMLFAFLIWRIGYRHPQCIGRGIDEGTNYFMDAFALSWTTFSTVGYGLIYSGISADKPDIKECTGITILVTLEAFFGVLFASFCELCQVAFSDPIVIRYGSGVQVEDPVDTDDPDATGEQGSHIPCPVLEFRIVNRLNGTVGGEILDSTVNLVASIDKSQAQTVARNQVRKRRGKKGKRKPPRRQAPAVLRQRGASMRVISEDLLSASGSDDDGKGIEDAEKGASPLARPEFTIRRSSRFVNPDTNTPIPLLSIQLGRQSFDEDPAGYLVPKKVFSKLGVESPDHPFFKRVWIVRHRLDHESPLLVTKARQMVKNHHGHWPAELNNAAGVRAAVKFDQILVSLSGTSNADANSVYAQKVYEYCDLSVGYRFVNLLFRDPVDESLRADIRLINDVVEQAGGGGEPFGTIDRKGSIRSMGKMLVL